MDLFSYNSVKNIRPYWENMILYKSLVFYNKIQDVIRKEIIVVDTLRQRQNCKFRQKSSDCKIDALPGTGAHKIPELPPPSLLVRIFQEFFYPHATFYIYIYFRLWIRIKATQTLQVRAAMYKQNVEYRCP